MYTAFILFFFVQALSNSYIKLNTFMDELVIKTHVYLGSLSGLVLK